MFRIDRVDRGAADRDRAMWRRQSWALVVTGVGALPVARNMSTLCGAPDGSVMCAAESPCPQWDLRSFTDVDGHRLRGLGSGCSGSTCRSVRWRCGCTGCVAAQLRPRPVIVVLRVRHRPGLVLVALDEQVRVELSAAMPPSRSLAGPQRPRTAAVRRTVRGFLSDAASPRRGSASGCREPSGFRLATHTSRDVPRYQQPAV
jgi:hypothetical protein